MRELNNKIAKLERLGKIEALKLRHRKRNLTLDFRRKIAAEFAKQFNNKIFISLPT